MIIKNIVACCYLFFTFPSGFHSVVALVKEVSLWYCDLKCTVCVDCRHSRQVLKKLTRFEADADRKGFSAQQELTSMSREVMRLQGHLIKFVGILALILYQLRNRCVP